MDKRIHINGFTMIEMIFVLLLLVLLSGLSTLIHQPKKQKDDMIIQISQVFDHARLHSVTHKEKTTISVTSKKLRVRSRSLKEELDLDAQYSFLTPHQFTYNLNGRIKTAKTIHLKTPSGVVKFVFQLGSGTYYVQS